MLYTDVMYANFIKKILVANEQPREDARLRGGSLMEQCTIVPGEEKISNRSNRVMQT